MGRAVLPRRDEQWATPVRSILAAEEQNSDHKHTICYSVHTVVTVHHIRVQIILELLESDSLRAMIWPSRIERASQHPKSTMSAKMDAQSIGVLTPQRCSKLQTIGIWCLKMCTTIRRRYLNTQTTPHHVWNFFITLVPFRAKSFQLLPRHRKTNLDKNI